MGEISAVVNEFMRDKRRFADAFNGFCFKGQQVIQPEDLEDASEQYAKENGDSENPGATERFRDVKMRLKSGGELRILAVENQSYVDYAMPYRCMEYDCLEYGRQLKELETENRKKKLLYGMNEWLSGIRKTDRLMPNVTICLYHGEDEWDGPRTLREMMDFGEDADGMRNLFEDYPLRLFCVNEYDNFNMFQTELRDVFTALNYRKDLAGMQKLMEENEAYRYLDRDSLRVLSLLLKQPKIWQEREKYMSKNGETEGYDMCQALRELKEEGRIEGREEALTMMIKVVSVLREDGNMTDAEVAVRCECSEAEVNAIRKAFEI